MKFIDPEEIKTNNEEDKESQPVEVYKEEAEPDMPEIDDAQIRALALAYARYLKEHGLAPGDATYVEPEEIGVSDAFDIEFDFDLNEEDEASEESRELLEEELFGGMEVSLDEPSEEEPAEEETADEVEESVEEEVTETEESLEEAEAVVEEETAEEPVEEPAEEDISEETVEEEPLEEPDEEEIVEEIPAEEPAVEEVPEEETEPAADEFEESVEEPVEEPVEEEISEENVEEEPVEEPVEEEIPEEGEESVEEEVSVEEQEESVEEEELPAEEVPETEELLEDVEPVVEEETAEEPAEETVEDTEETVEEEPLEEPVEEEIAEEIVEEIPAEELTEEEKPPIEEELPEEEIADESEEIVEEIPAEELTEEESVEEEVLPVEEPEEIIEELPVEELTEEETVEQTAEEEPVEEEISEEVEESEEEVEPEEAPAEEKAPEEKKEEEDPRKKAAREAKERAAQKKIQKRNRAKEKKKAKFLKGGRVPLAGVTNLHDKVQDGIDGAFVTVGKQFITGAHRISSTYRQSRKFIGVAVLITGLLAAGLLIVFDMFTVYEYAYNGKVLGYVKNQEEVTDVLDVAGRQLTYNSSTEADVKFVANENVTFNPVDGRGKSTDDSDTVVNKLIYMTDIETEAYAVFDGDKVVAVVKDQNDADRLLLNTKDDLSIPDRGMELVSAEFLNELSVKPVNVLLGSVQSNAAAQEQMTNGGEMNIYHIIEDGETIKGLASEFGVEDFEIYNEDNSEPVTEIETGDRVCIRCLVNPVGVEMVEKGKIKEVIEYETIKKESDEYYKGDSFLEQEGQDGVQLFEGYITKISGEETKRKPTKEPEIIKEKKDKIIVVGTAERPKTAATGTFIVPLDHYVITSEWGGRWGRMHEGMDLAAPTGTPIHASDGGKIIKANYWSGHGLCVEIDHGNGVVTRYSHCSAVFVSIGDLVYQGQHIANVGNTGHSFGSHCHFEVRVNDTSQNPRNYINP